MFEYSTLIIIQESLINFSLLKIDEKIFKAVRNTLQQVFCNLITFTPELWHSTNKKR